MGRVLGIDLGLARTGLAVSDELGLTARALPNLTPRSRAEDIDALVTLIVDLEVEHVVVGLPVMPRSGDEGPLAKRFRNFAQTLHATLQERGMATAVHLVDEAHSSKHAAQRLVESGIRKGKRRAALDGEVARGLVLEWVAAHPPQG